MPLFIFVWFFLFCLSLSILGHNWYKQYLLTRNYVSDYSSREYLKSSDNLFTVSDFNNTKEVYHRIFNITASRDEVPTVNLYKFPNRRIVKDIRRFVDTDILDSSLYEKLSIIVEGEQKFFWFIYSENLVVIYLSEENFIVFFN